jgi:GMP synthase (glutamine-hydrolysing)
MTKINNEMLNKFQSDNILIVDFGSQFTQLIARRVREEGVFCQIIPYNKVDEYLLNNQPKAIILSGGPSSVIGFETPRIPQNLINLDKPILGICYGQQVMVEQLGGQVISSEKSEFGRAKIKMLQSCSLTKNVWEIGNEYQVWMSHGDSVVKIPDGFSIIAETEGAAFAAIANEEKKQYGVQFHPEVVHTIDGKKLINNFVKVIAECKPSWSMESFSDYKVNILKKQIGDGKVLCGLSGGVDSSVTAALLDKAIGDQLVCVFVDHGLLRGGEAKEIDTIFKERLGSRFIHVNASEIFLNALKNISDPEKKRKTIGKKFVEVFELEAKKIGNVKFLAQGTLYPDVIESVSFFGGPSVTIKSHHNVGGLPEKMNLELVEPLRELFKDEVRILGKELGLPDYLIGRHPFPGPGLAIRIPGIIKEESVKTLQKADNIFIDEIRKANLYDKIWQAFCVLLPVKSVGVMGDARSYDQALVLRAITSVDGMTADIYPFEQSFLNRVSTRIVNEVKGINRVTYDITSKPPGTIEWE